jgi:hypothetical protein
MKDENDRKSVDESVKLRHRITRLEVPRILEAGRTRYV